MARLNRSYDYRDRMRQRFREDPFSAIILYSILLSIFFLIFAFRGLIATIFIKPLGIVNPQIGKIFNTESTAEVAPVTEEEEQEDLPGSFTLRSSDTYEVKSGDTLSSIANTLGIKWQDLAEYNELQPPYDLKVGQTLKIPPLD